VLNVLSRQEVEALAQETGFYLRKPKEIKAFEFTLCCALGAIVEQKRGFASVWRLLATAAGIQVARSAVTQRFGEGSAALLVAVFHRAVEKVAGAGPSIDRAKLNQFQEVMAQDGTVLKLTPLLKKMFPATRTNVVDAAAKVHVAGDLRERRIVDVTVTGERESELEELYKVIEFKANGLYLFDLGYTSYDLLSLIKRSHAFVLMRLKDNANPTVVHVREGIRRPHSSRGLKLKHVDFCKTADRFDLDAEFCCSTVAEKVTMRVVGVWNPETQRHHRYVTNLPPEMFNCEELATLYKQRWTIELLMKLLKSSCHLDHLDTENPDALRTHIYASLLAAVILQSLIVTAAMAGGIPTEHISFLTVGITAPMLVIPLLLLWLKRELTHEELSRMIIRTILYGCCNQNPGRTRDATVHLR
jgi:IS4 transposase